MTMSFSYTECYTEFQNDNNSKMVVFFFNVLFQFLEDGRGQKEEAPVDDMLEDADDLVSVLISCPVTLLHSTHLSGHLL